MKIERYDLSSNIMNLPQHNKELLDYDIADENKYMITLQDYSRGEV